MKTSRKGLLLVVISGIVFGIMPSTVAYCYTQGATPVLMMLSRSVLFELILLPIVLRAKNTWELYRKTWKQHFLLSITGTGTPLILFITYNYMPTGIATTLHYLYPTVVALICILFLHEKMSRIKCIALVSSFLGIAIMMDTSVQDLSAVGIALAVLSSITWALYILLLDKVDLQGASSLQVMFFSGISSIILLSLCALVNGDFAVTITPIGWAAMAISNLAISIGGSLFFVIGVRYTDAQTSAIASTLEPIVSIVIGVLFLREAITFRTGVGSVLILAAVIMLAVFDQPAEKA